MDAARLAKIEENKRIGSEFYHAFGIEKDVAKLRPYFGETYVQHNPSVQEGPESFFRFVQFRHDHFPEGRNNVKLTIVDEDRIMFHVHSVLTPGEPGRNLVDTFRIRDGKILEHWDVIQPLSEPKFPGLHDNGLFNEQGDSILDALDLTDENRRIATEFYTALTTEKDPVAVARYLGDTYIEHNPRLESTPESLLSLARFRAEHFPEAHNDIKVTVAQGNLVGFHVHSVLVPGELGRNLVDILRLEDGKVVEHWGTAQDIELLRFPPINDSGLY